jgi:hypothetical protein
LGHLFLVTEAGEVDYSAAEEGFFSGRGTSTLGLGKNFPPVPNAGGDVEILSRDLSTTVIEGSATDPEDDDMTFRWLEGGVALVNTTDLAANGSADLDLGDLDCLSIGMHTLTLEVKDGCSTVTTEMVLTVGNTPPAGAPTMGGTYEIGCDNSITLGGQVADFDGDTVTFEWRVGTTTIADSDGSVTTTKCGAPVDLPTRTVSTKTLGTGTHTIDLVVDDGENDEVLASITVDVVDTTDPTMSLTASKAILWPPNGKMSDVQIKTNAMDNSCEAVALEVSIKIIEDRPDFFCGKDFDLDTEVVAINPVTGVIDVKLRAERCGPNGSGYYRIRVTAPAASDNESVSSVDVLVPGFKVKE